jgi:aspartyl-tRNA(Asn)/glutamyl-tRNA(Gln) amidotransferase subunit B
MKSKLPILPDEIRSKLSTLKVEQAVIEDVMDRDSLVPKILESLEKTTAENTRHVLFQLLDEPDNIKIDLKDQITIAEMLSDKKLSSTAAKEALVDIRAGKSLEEATAGRMQVSDEGLIEKIVAEVIAENEKAAEDVKKGEMKAIGFLVGQVMKKSQGKANPGLAQELIKKQLGI